MAMSSGVYSKTLLDALANASALDLSGTPDTVKWQYVTDSETPDYNNVSPDETDITTEASAVTTAGTYTLGGEPLVTISLTQVTQYLKFDDSSDVALTGTTISAEGVIGFDDTITTPIADPLLWGTDFTTTYTSTAGAFNITWSADGIWRIQVY